MTSTFTSTEESAGPGALRDLVGDRVVLPGEAGWDDARQAWNLAKDQRPAAVVFPESAADVAAVVAFARRRGLRVATQATGHFAGTLDWSEETILVRTTGMREIAVDAPARRARIGAGVLSEELVLAAGEHGLAFPAGSSPDVGVVGYALGGGIGWLGRRYGLAANGVVAVELVTADGRVLRADRDHESDLFWAVRGGGGSFGIVTALELELHPVAEVHAGILFWPLERAADVLRAWSAWTQDAPRDVTSAGRLLRFPPIPEVPEHLRGRSFVAVEAAFLGGAAQADELLLPLRALGPELDTFATMPASDLRHLHMDPPGPVPGAGDGMGLAALPGDAVDALVAVAGADSGSPLLSVELRQLGGAFADSSPGHGAAGALDFAFALFAVGMAMDEESGEAALGAAQAVQGALAPWAARGYFNFRDRPADPETLYPADVYRRLREIKAAVDPGELFHASHAIPPAV